MRLGEILKKVADAGGVATSESVANMMNIRKDKVSAYMDRLYKKGWVSKQGRTSLRHGGFANNFMMTSKGFKYLNYMAKISQQPKINADQIISDLENVNFWLRRELHISRKENNELEKENMKKDDKIKDMKSSKDFWLWQSMEMKNEHKKAMESVRRATDLIEMYRRTYQVSAE